MKHSAEFFSPRIADELRAMQSNLISIENVCNKHRAMLHSAAALCNNIAGSYDSALCSKAHIREYLREFEAECKNILG
jgi:hypothetical protein